MSEAQKTGRATGTGANTSRKGNEEMTAFERFAEDAAKFEKSMAANHEETIEVASKINKAISKLSDHVNDGFKGVNDNIEKAVARNEQQHEQTQKLIKESGRFTKFGVIVGSISAVCVFALIMWWMPEIIIRTFDASGNVLSETVNHFYKWATAILAAVGLGVLGTFLASIEPEGNKMSQKQRQAARLRETANRLDPEPNPEPKPEPEPEPEPDKAS